MESKRVLSLRPKGWWLVAVILVALMAGLATSASAQATGSI